MERLTAVGKVSRSVAPSPIITKLKEKQRLKLEQFSNRAVERNYPCTIATLSDWLKSLAPGFQPMRSETKTNRTLYAWFLTRFENVTCNCEGILIGSSRCSLLSWLVEVMTSVLVFWQLFDKGTYWGCYSLATAKQAYLPSDSKNKSCIWLTKWFIVECAYWVMDVRGRLLSMRKA